jgi:hypothetical protein
MHPGDGTWHVSTAQGYLVSVARFARTVAERTKGSSRVAEPPPQPETTARKPVHDRQRSRREPGDAVRVEDVIPAEILNDTRVDREYLEQVFREPQKFLPPRVKQEPLPEPEQPPEEPESRLARRAKLVALLAAAALVAGSIIIAATVTSQHRALSPTTPDAGPAQAAGASALGGYAVSDPSSTGRPPAKAQRTSAKPSSVTSVVDTPARSELSVSTASAAPPRTSTAPTTIPQKLEAVKNFYKMVDDDPQDALSLVVPPLVGQELGRLVRAWSSMDSIQVQRADVQPDGSILAIVTMLQPDGSQLRITQMLRLADDASGLISEARLLSTQRM